MFANALKSFASTNINTNYTISPARTSTAGPWKIYPAKHKKTGKEGSVFVFDKKSVVDAHRSGLNRAELAEFKRAVEAVVERLKKEAAAITKLRHPGILEVIEPVEETRGGGLQFVAEPVTASLAGLLQEKDDQERGGGRASRYVTEDADGNRRRRELEIDELEIQKGLLQISKALEFLHENAGLVHGNLTPDAILVNGKVGSCSEPLRNADTDRVKVGLETQRPVLLQPVGALESHVVVNTAHQPERGSTTQPQPAAVRPAGS